MSALQAKIGMCVWPDSSLLRRASVMTWMSTPQSIESPRMRMAARSPLVSMARPLLAAAAAAVDPGVVAVAVAVAGGEAWPWGTREG